MKRLLWFLVCMMAAGIAPALATDRDPVAEAAIEQSLAQIAPDQLPAFRQATLAMDNDAFADAAPLLARICEQVPTFSPAARRLGYCLCQQGQRAEGIAWCRKAVGLERSFANLVNLAYCLAVGVGQEVPRADKVEAFDLFGECSRMPSGEVASTLAATAQLALELEKLPEFRDAVESLRRGFPDLMATHYFGAILAAMDGKWLQADREIKTARRLGLDPEAAQAFLDAGVGRRAAGWRAAQIVLAAAVIWVVGLGLLFALGTGLSRATLNQSSRLDAARAVSAGERRLRALYRVILNLAGIYYYLSLPVVLVLVVVTTAAIVYAFLLIGWIPLQLLAIIVIGAIVTVMAMARSVFLKVEVEDPGRVLAREEAPGLWELTEEVARTLGARPLDEIRITSDSDLAVYERGTWRERLQDRGRRVLVLGVAVLHGFRQDDFRCVLAHEYGHFSHRDTAGGDIGLRVRNDMMKFYLAMYTAGQATALNLAFHFLRFYHFLFRRISHGATRLQEILADRFAAQTYGALALEGGLRHIIHRQLEFTSAANHEIERAIDARRPLQNLYEARLEDGVSVEEDFDKALTRPTTGDDTHPSPVDRFRLVAPYVDPACPPRAGEVWELFADPAAIVREMMAGFEERVAPYRSFEDENRKAADAAPIGPQG